MSSFEDLATVAQENTNPTADVFIEHILAIQELRKLHSGTDLFTPCGLHYGVLVYIPKNISMIFPYKVCVCVVCVMHLDYVTLTGCTEEILQS